MPASVVPVLLLMTSDLQLSRRVAGLAARVGLRCEVVERIRAGGDWTAPELVLVGIDAVVQAESARLPARRDLLAIASGPVTAAEVAAAAALGVERLLELPRDEPDLSDRMALLATRARVRPHQQVVTVVGGRGGAGATTLACALAVTAARAGLEALLVDADPLGGGLELAMGSEDVDGLRWDGLVQIDGAVRGSDLARRLPRVDGVRVLSCPRAGLDELPAPAMRAVLEAGAATHELVVVDLPRQLGEAALEALALSTLTLVVVPAQVRAASAAARVIAVVRPLATDVRLVVRGPSPSGLDAELIADSLGVPLDGELRPEPGLDADIDRGLPPARRGRGPLAAYCSRVLASAALSRTAA